MKKELFDITPRLEASDFERDWEKTTGTVHLHLHIGSRRTGVVEAKWMGGDQLQLCWPPYQGRSKQCQVIECKSITDTHGRKVTCGRCPKCKKLRKQLFLNCSFAGGLEDDLHHQFVCQFCFETDRTVPALLEPGKETR